MYEEWSNLKKLIWLYTTKLKNKFKKLIVSGISPLSLVNAIAHPIVSLIQYGKCEQNGTPTPSDPVDIYCNNGKLVMVDDELPSGYKRVLGFTCDNNALWEITGFHLKGSDTVRISFSVTQACNVFGCYQGTDATDNYDLYVSITSGSKYFRYGNGTYLSYWSSSNLGQRFDVVYTPTGSQGMPQDSTWSALTFESANNLLIGSTTLTGTSSKLRGNLYEDFVVENGGVERLHLIPCERVSDNVLGYYDKVGETFYEPYTGFDGAVSLGYDGSHYEFTVVGTPEVIEVIPCGAWDANDNAVVQGTIASSDGQDGGASASRVRTGGYMTVEPNTEYTISTNLRGIYLFQYAEDKSYLSTSVASGWKSSPYTFMTNASCAFIRATLAKNYPATSASVSPSDCEYVQVVKGSSVVKQTASAGNLFAVGDCADTEELIAGIKTGRVGVYCASGESECYMPSENIFRIVLPNGKAEDSLDGLCTHYKFYRGASTPAADKNFAIYKATYGGIPKCCFGVRDNSISTLEAFKAMLDEKRPIILYPLGEETTQQTTAHALTTAQGTNIVSWTAEVDGKTMSCIYDGYEEKG